MQDEKKMVEAADVVMFGRHSIRAYLSTPVPQALIEEILAIASRAPSGTNTQPWHVHVVSGATRDHLVAAACAVYDTDPDYGETTYNDVYLNLDVPPYIARKRVLGKAMYGLMGIGKGDTAGMLAQRRRNFELFGAPVGLFFTIDRNLGRGSWMDTGMFMQNVMLAARARGLDTCPQAYWVRFESVAAKAIGWPAEERLVSAICLGYADHSAPENQLISEREPVAQFAVFHD